MESGDLQEELKYAVVSKMTDQTEIQNEILSYAATLKKIGSVGK